MTDSTVDFDFKTRLLNPELDVLESTHVPSTNSCPGLDEIQKRCGIYDRLAHDSFLLTEDESSSVSNDLSPNEKAWVGARSAATLLSSKEADRSYERILASPIITVVEESSDDIELSRDDTVYETLPQTQDVLNQETPKVPHSTASLLFSNILVKKSNDIPRRQMGLLGSQSHKLDTSNTSTQQDTRNSLSSYRPPTTTLVSDSDSSSPSEDDDSTNEQRLDSNTSNEFETDDRGVICRIKSPCENLIFRYAEGNRIPPPLFTRPSDNRLHNSRDLTDDSSISEPLSHVSNDNPYNGEGSMCRREKVNASIQVSMDSSRSSEPSDGSAVKSDVDSIHSSSSSTSIKNDESTCEGDSHASPVGSKTRVDEDSSVSHVSASKDDDSSAINVESNVVGGRRKHALSRLVDDSSDESSVDKAISRDSSPQNMRSVCSEMFKIDAMHTHEDPEDNVDSSSCFKNSKLDNPRGNKSDCSVSEITPDTMSSKPCEAARSPKRESLHSITPFKPPLRLPGGQKFNRNFQINTPRKLFNSSNQLLIVDRDSGGQDLETRNARSIRRLKISKPLEAKKMPETPLTSAMKKKGVEMLSFMSSLSLTEVTEECHDDAVKFINKFTRHKTELARTLFNIFNGQVFLNALPENMEITWNNRLRKTAGQCLQQSRKCSNSESTGPVLMRTSRIELSSKVLDSCDRLRDTLAHELCHAAAWIISGCKAGHGPIWRDWINRMRSMFPELPLLERCHTYAIRTKYIYVCERCGYEIGRHSKSIDTENMVCGVCGGVFRVQITTSSKNNVRGECATPRTPNKFAMFVKENYKTVRTTGTPHRDTMKTLSEMFSRNNRITTVDNNDE